MRIRKHAKISPLVYAASSLKPGTVLQPHVCQLNQSPWDVMSFSPPSTPPPSQVNRDGVYAGNGSSGHCISVVEREHNVRRQSESSDGFADNTTTIKVEQSAPVKNERVILCCKTDGKSWQCRREAAKGYSLCEHHISLMKSYNNLAHSSTKKPAAEARRPTRPKKASTSSSSNPYEFYYYSGFGPRWGKKRGENCKNINGCSSLPKNLDPEHEMESSSTLSQIGEEQFDYAEDEDDEDEEVEDREKGKKRVRKPIKARSLKSLM